MNESTIEKLAQHAIKRLSKRKLDERAKRVAMNAIRLSARVSMDNEVTFTNLVQDGVNAIWNAGLCQ